MKSLIFLAASATALIAAPAAFAEDDPQAVVEFGTAELTSQAGLSALRGKIHDAAETVCVAPHRPTLSERRLQSACIANAIAGAEAQLQQKIAALEPRYFAEATATEEDQG
jgi:UrcA family protein